MTYAQLVAQQARLRREIEAQRERDRQCPYCKGTRRIITATGVVFCTAEWHSEPKAWAMREAAE